VDSWKLIDLIGLIELIGLIGLIGLKHQERSDANFQLPASNFIKIIACPVK
jgi:hypothetical protein